MSTTNRRRFLVLIGGAAGGLAGAGWLLNDRRATDTPVVSRSSQALGANVTLTVVHRDREVANRAIEAAFRELDLVEDVLSLYRPHSQLCELNRTGQFVGPHPFLVEVLRASHAMSTASQGAFDVTVQPLWELLAAAKKAGRELSTDEIAAVRQLVNWQDVQIDADEIKLRRPGMAVTLNGIAQGFATDRVAQVLREHGIERALVDAGEICAWGERKAGGPWRVGVQHPRREAAYLAIAALDNRCLATSGDYATNFRNARGSHHIFDPHTGTSPQHFSSVSIVAPTAMQADAFSTALFVLDLPAGLKLIEATPGMDVLFVQANGDTVSTKGFPVVDA